MCSFYFEFLPLSTAVYWKRGVYVQDTGSYSMCWLCQCTPAPLGSTLSYVAWYHYQPTDGAVLSSNAVSNIALATYLLPYEAHIACVMFCVLPPHLSFCKQLIRISAM